ncbi:UNKNOWN [Stylonychia lemnae]|uniref:Lebercilin domain-containing protein n=1 Tax=Stylonychia lemnae TaxID=5949 RepID=A0A078AZV7_STYLE|nr:UNKNOWN [Stylonychia lemnae]|eukprot:CDW87626.1 UNKNOWN [Stylonychia lemnae]
MNVSSMYHQTFNKSGNHAGILQEISQNNNQLMASYSTDKQSPLEAKIQTKWSNELQNELISELKHNLNQETQINQDLRLKLEQIARKHLIDKENLDTEKNQLNQKLQQVNMHMQQLMQENVTLKKQNVYLERTNKEFTHKNKVYQNQLTQLRAFVVHLTSDLDAHKKKDFRYPLAIDCNDKNLIILRQDLERLQNESKRHLNDLKIITSKFEQSQEALNESKLQINKLKKESNVLIQQLKNQLIGAVRRINYLIEEKKKIEEEITKRAKYTAKLELKIVQENLNNKGLRQKVQNLQDGQHEAKIREQLDDFDKQYCIQSNNIMSQSQKISSIKEQKRPNTTLKTVGVNIPISGRRQSQSRQMNQSQNLSTRRTLNLQSVQNDVQLPFIQFTMPQTVSSPIINSKSHSRSQSQSRPTVTINPYQNQMNSNSKQGNDLTPKKFENQNNNLVGNSQNLNMNSSNQNILSECLSQSDHLNQPAIINQNTYLMQQALNNHQRQQISQINGNNNCNFQDMQSIEDMFASMDRQVQAYYQLQQNIEVYDEQEKQETAESMNWPRSTQSINMNTNYKQKFENEDEDAFDQEVQIVNSKGSFIVNGNASNSTPINLNQKQYYNQNFNDIDDDMRLDDFQPPCNAFNAQNFLGGNVIEETTEEENDSCNY